MKKSNYRYKVGVSWVYSMQLMQKFEYNEAFNPRFYQGIFCLSLESIKVYGGKTKNSRFILISSVSITYPGLPGLNLDEEPSAVEIDEQLGEF